MSLCRYGVTASKHALCVSVMIWCMSYRVMCAGGGLTAPSKSYADMKASSIDWLKYHFEPNDVTVLSRLFVEEGITHVSDALALTADQLKSAGLKLGVLNRVTAIQNMYKPKPHSQSLIDAGLGLSEGGGLTAPPVPAPNSLARSKVKDCIPLSLTDGAVRRALDELNVHMPNDLWHIITGYVHGMFVLAQSVDS